MSVVDTLAGKIVDADTRVTGESDPADMTARLEVMDGLGVDRALIFPAAPLAIGPDSAGALKAHNDWCIEVAKVSDRLRPVAVVDTTSIGEAIAEAQRVIEAGVRAVGMSAAVPPGEIASGHPDLDPLWSVFAQAKVPVLLREEAQLGMFRSQAWTPQGEGALLFTMAQAHVLAKNFLTSMIYGGVFERHPDLHVGVIGVGAGWVGPMAENLDGVGEKWFSKKLTKVLTRKPSEYIATNIRVTSSAWEPLHHYITRYGLEDIYIYGSATTMTTNQPNPITTITEHLTPTQTHKYLTTNTQHLTP